MPAHADGGNSPPALAGAEPADAAPEKTPSGPVRVLKVLALTLLAVLTLLFAAVGVLYFTRETPARAVHAFGEVARPPAPGEPAFLQTIQLLAGTPLAPGHAVEILMNGDGTFPRLWADMRSARSTLTVQLYYCNPGAVADSLKAVMMGRARAGVATHFLYDGFGAEPLTDAYMDSLRAAGVRVAVFRPVKWYSLHKAQYRSHVRAVVVDGRVGYTGGFGIDDRWLGGGQAPDEWRETNVRFEGPAVEQLQAAFAAAWTEATGQLLVGGAYFPESVSGAAGGAVAGLQYAAPTLGSTSAERLLALTIAGARRTLYVANAYPVPTPFLRRELMGAARRGVDVRLLLPNERTDVPLTRYAAHSFYAELLGGGVRIFEYQPAMMHAKTFVADGQWSAIGSMNLDNRSLAYNDESTLLVLDRRIGAAMDSLFHEDLGHAREILLETFARRPWHARWREWLAGLVVNLL